MESIWKNIAAELAELGPAKSVEQWKTTWRDLKSKTKTKNVNINLARKRTGNNENVPVLTTGEEKILGITGKTTSQVANDDIVQCSPISSESSQNIRDKPFIPEDKFKHNSTQTDITMKNQEILKQLKDKFNDPSTSRSMKTLILTTAPTSWSEKKLTDEIETSRWQARKIMRKKLKRLRDCEIKKEMEEIFGFPDGTVSEDDEEVSDGENNCNANLERLLTGEDVMLSSAVSDRFNFQDYPSCI
ncbi:unnamed protein product [Danaus chrysippus]|uniref:(African queen) hypothetical protein n=1 Tax=Danaus chrysippus TaxID=151541 RepID=A0A8J2W6E4_9NEOP|nr:unnamed protein product [Danaus chrysippus]